MSVKIEKGEEKDITRNNPGLSRIMVSIGWNEAEPKPEQEIDCDTVAFLLDKNGNIPKRYDVIFYNHPAHRSGCVVHQGDNLKEIRKIEQILIDFSKMPELYERVVIVLSIYEAGERHQHLGMLEKVFIRLSDPGTGEEICIYSPFEKHDGMMSLVLGELYKNNGEWKFTAGGEASQEHMVPLIGEKYGLNRNWRPH